MIPTIDTGRGANGSIRTGAGERFACLSRHWAWTDEAMSRFERELADGWTYDEDLAADHPFGALYHWCALLSTFSEAALADGLLSPSQFASIRADLDDSRPGLQACRSLLLTIPSTIESHPLLLELVRDDDRLGRLRRVHQAFADAMRGKGVSREVQAIEG